MVLLDTDVMIDLLRQYPPAVAWLESLGEEEIILPGFVAMELFQGCRNKMEQEKLEKELDAYAVVWPSSEICDEALVVFVRFVKVLQSAGNAVLNAIFLKFNVSIYQGFFSGGFTASICHRYRQPNFSNRS